MPVGDIVQQKGESVLMMIQEILGEKAKCIWYDMYGHAETGRFAIADLELVRLDKWSEKKTGP